MNNIGQAVLFISMLGCASVCSSAPDVQNSKAEPIGASQREQDIVLKRSFWQALGSTELAARVYFSGVCHKPNGLAMLLPEMEVHVPAKDHTGLEAVQDIFQNDSNVVVSEDRPEIITIKIGNPSLAILSTRLPALLLNQDEQYNPIGPGSAISAIEKTSEFRAALMRLKIVKMEVLHGGLESPPDETLPHLPPIIKDTTVDRALDLIAKTFRGVILYGVCKEQNGESFIDIEFKPFPTTKGE